MCAVELTGENGRESGEMKLKGPNLGRMRVSERNEGKGGSDESEIE
jgi:hypothetical protein